MQDASRRRVLTGWVIAAVVAMGGVAAAEPAKVADDGSIAARVNGRPIYLKQFKFNVDKALAKLQKKRSVKAAEEARRKIQMEELSRQVDQELMVQAGEKVSKLDLEKEIEVRIKAQQSSSSDKGSPSARPALVTPDEAREKVRRQLLIDEFLKKRGMGELRVPEADQKTYYAENKENFRMPESVKVSHVLIPLAKEAKSKEVDTAREKIEMIIKEAKNGRDFAELAKQYSASSDAKEGGDLGYIVRGTLPAVFCDAAFKLKPGELSEVVQTWEGLHVIKAFDKKPSYIREFAEVKDLIEKHLLNKLRLLKLEELTQELRRDAQIEITLK